MLLVKAGGLDAFWIIQEKPQAVSFKSSCAGVVISQDHELN